MQTQSTEERRMLGAGTVVLIVLVAMTAVEFVVAVAGVPGLIFILLVIGVGKAWAIVQYFMHIGQLRGSDH